ncbi:hypothetical protein WJX73_004191 [Symbiochloris irregularis]|uniref:Uncharacterized protein n=1 Tax=Symbiochloris irregularis TaxID=706552 RepID=A0AAW1PLM2_9CHLO
MIRSVGDVSSAEELDINCTGLCNSKSHRSEGLPRPSVVIDYLTVPDTPPTGLVLNSTSRTASRTRKASRRRRCIAGLTEADLLLWQSPAERQPQDPHSIPSPRWGGEAGNKDAAQDILVKLAKANSEAQLGQSKGPTPPLEGSASSKPCALGAPASD